MATASFEKSFVVKDKRSIDQIHQDLATPRLVKVKKRDYKAENARGIQLLKQRLEFHKSFLFPHKKGNRCLQVLSSRQQKCKLILWQFHTYLACQ